MPVTTRCAPFLMICFEDGNVPRSLRPSLRAVPRERCANFDAIHDTGTPVSNIRCAYGSFLAERSAKQSGPQPRFLAAMPVLTAATTTRVLPWQGLNKAQQSVSRDPSRQVPRDFDRAGRCGQDTNAEIPRYHKE